jgi:2-polyprenyl-6-methoxyphenol hydroxylase-like FAD-dependent oxidoreductase
MKTDVVVVGGRVAGAATAMLLARAGLRVVLLDRGRYGTDTLSTHALMRAGVLQLARWGLLDRLVANGTPPVRLTSFRYGEREPIQVSIRASGGVDALYAPRRHLLDRVLVDAAADAGALVRHGTYVTGLLRDRAGRVCGVQTREGDTAGDIPARYVVGADGISSVVAHAVEPRVLKRGRWASAVRYAYYTGFETSGYEWSYANGVAAGMIPTNGAETCVFVATTPLRMRMARATRTPEEAFQVLFRLAAPGQSHRLSAARPVGRERGWAGLRGYVRSAWGPGWALVGDAGYYKDPITAHGMTDALRDAELLSSALVAAMSGSDRADTALEAYQEQRDALSASLFRVSDEIAAYDWDDDQIQALLRRLSAAMTDEVELLGSLPSRLSGSAPLGAPLAQAGVR